MNTTSAIASPFRVRRVRFIGAAGFRAGLVGAMCGALLIFCPAQVPPDVFSCPLTGRGFALFQVLLGLQHLVLAALLVAVTLTAAVGHSKMARGGFMWAAWVMILLAAEGIFAIAAAP